MNLGEMALITSGIHTIVIAFEMCMISKSHVWFRIRIEERKIPMKYQRKEENEMGQFLTITYQFNDTNSWTSMCLPLHSTEWTYKQEQPAERKPTQQKETTIKLRRWISLQKTKDMQVNSEVTRITNPWLRSPLTEA